MLFRSLLYEYAREVFDRRFTSQLKVRVPQLPSDVHGVATLEHLASVLVKEQALSS